MCTHAAMVIEEVENLRRRRVNLNQRLEVVLEQALIFHVRLPTRLELT